MKTAISLPDDTFELATRRAQELGISRSEFFAQAARRYLEELDGHSLTSQIDQAVLAIGGGDESSRTAAALGRQLLNDESDW